MPLTGISNILTPIPIKTRGHQQTGVSYQPAAVMVAVTDHQKDADIILTRRTAHLTHHAGQVCFPGGRTEEDDYDHMATALRETEEEIGIHPDFLDIYGCLDLYYTQSGFAVTPVVAGIRPGYKISPDPAEVADVFTLPLSHILKPGAFQTQYYDVNGRSYQIPEMTYAEYKIWGITAGILQNLASCIAEASDTPPPQSHKG